ncbi:MAG: 4-hydroxythreonine-4-phosphate dehydrogenase PdxA [Chitinophagales bacterium]
MKTFSDERIYKMATPVVFANPRVFSYYKKALKLDRFQYTTIKNFETTSHNSLNIFPAWEEEFDINIGKPTKETGAFALKSLAIACKALQDNQIDALVTAPINKHMVQQNEKDFSGQTEFLQQYFKSENNLMFMTSDLLKVGLVTNHKSIKDVAASITEDLILKKIKLMHQSLMYDFGISKPKIAVLALNPHAGDKGTIGSEEIDIIYPAVLQARAENMLVFGPYAADGFFGSGNYAGFDGILAMYHDQGLIPFKLMAQENGINFTAGMDIIRTSPDHGTAEDIAGKGVADETSFRNAIYAAIDIYNNRAEYEQNHSNPLTEFTEHQEDR